MKKLSISSWLEKKPLPAIANGIERVEKKISLSIEDMYNRMLALGELRQATIQGESREIAIEKLEKCAPLAAYLKEGEIKKYTDEVEKMELKLYTFRQEQEEEVLFKEKALKRGFTQKTEEIDTKKE